MTNHNTDRGFGTRGRALYCSPLGVTFTEFARLVCRASGHHACCCPVPGRLRALRSGLQGKGSRLADPAAYPRRRRPCLPAATVARSPVPSTSRQAPWPPWPRARARLRRSRAHAEAQVSVNNLTSVTVTGTLFGASYTCSNEPVEVHCPASRLGGAHVWLAVLLRERVDRHHPAHQH